MTQPDEGKRNAPSESLQESCNVDAEVDVTPQGDANALSNERDLSQSPEFDLRDIESIFDAPDSSAPPAEHLGEEQRARKRACDQRDLKDEYLRSPPLTPKRLRTHIVDEPTRADLMRSSC